jgi:flagellar operon protein
LKLKRGKAMAIEINGVKVPFILAGGIETLRKERFGVPEAWVSFEEVLRSEIDNLKFSSHALKRLEERDIKLGVDDLKLLNDAIERAKKKNANDVLVLLRDIAFIVSVKNRTVVTVIDGDSMREHVFTNIDGAVVL